MRSGQEQIGEPRKDDPEKTLARKKKSESLGNAESRLIGGLIRIEGLSLATLQRCLIGLSECCSEPRCAWRKCDAIFLGKSSVVIPSSEAWCSPEKTSKLVRCIASPKKLLRIVRDEVGCRRALASARLWVPSSCLLSTTPRSPLVRPGSPAVMAPADRARKRLAPSPPYARYFSNSQIQSVAVPEIGG
jgi:hypothetical protein